MSEIDYPSNIPPLLPIDDDEILFSTHIQLLFKDPIRNENDIDVIKRKVISNQPITEEDVEDLEEFDTTADVDPDVKIGGYFIRDDQDLKDIKEIIEPIGYLTMDGKVYMKYGEKWYRVKKDNIKNIDKKELKTNRISLFVSKTFIEFGKFDIHDKIVTFGQVGDITVEGVDLDDVKKEIKKVEKPLAEEILRLGTAMRERLLREKNERIRFFEDIESGLKKFGKMLKKVQETAAVGIDPTVIEGLKKKLKENNFILLANEQRGKNIDRELKAQKKSVVKNEKDIKALHTPVNSLNDRLELVEDDQGRLDRNFMILRNSIPPTVKDEVTEQTKGFEALAKEFGVAAAKDEIGKLKDEMKKVAEEEVNIVVLGIEDTIKGEILESLRKTELKDLNTEVGKLQTSLEQTIEFVTGGINTLKEEVGKLQTSITDVEKNFNADLDVVEKRISERIEDFDRDIKTRVGKAKEVEVERVELVLKQVEIQTVQRFNVVQNTLREEIGNVGRDLNIKMDVEVKKLVKKIEDLEKRPQIVGEPVEEGKLLNSLLKKR